MSVSVCVRCMSIYLLTIRLGFGKGDMAFIVILPSKQCTVGPYPSTNHINDRVRFFESGDIRNFSKVSYRFCDR